MTNLSLNVRSGLEHLLAFHHGGLGAKRIALTLRNDVSLATIMTRRDTQPVLARKVQAEFGLALPGPLERAGTDSFALAWAAPGQWLAIAGGTDRSSFETRLTSALSGAASISNQSDGRTIIRIAGECSREVLAKGIPIDLHPSNFRPGSSAVTVAAHIGVHFWQLDDAPTYEFAVFRSFAAAFLTFLIECSSEFGFTLASD